MNIEHLMDMFDEPKMNLVYKEKPFPHFLIKYFYTDKQVEAIRDELKSLSKVLDVPENTKTATEKDGTPKKRNLGIFIGDVYKKQEASPIFNSSKKLFKLDVIEEIDSKNLIFKYFKMTNHDNILVQFYKNGDYYKPHSDLAVYSLITVFLMGEKKYTGGKLRFTEFDYELDLPHNNSILFPSFIEHEVTEVKIDSEDILDNRITITNFVTIK